ncbi:ABC transporter substrate-binding protein [Vibrio algarum]|uniref:ABC transporter substrate-binding protein n=1 Tax=Vibrio algarum TaxID=3020714 RepID=A0ABT4YTP5_9VIBR|nr:ABC transporter substrate-binding protein [Vibrio sp. KJ40-1]MDB1124936.1 ABC transporter substrate-binding protein [Vibrio sp. KJ40-1]
MFKTFSSTLLLTTMSFSTLAADKVNFQLDWLPGGDKAPVYVGIDKGIFEKYDLEVSINQGRGSTEAITKLATGISDVGIADISALMVAKANNDVPVSAVYSIFSQAPHAFFVIDNGEINSIADIKGKKVATSPFTSSNLYLPLVLEQSGFSEDEIQLVKADPGALGPMLATENTDVLISWVTSKERLISQAKQAGKTLKVMPWHEAGLEQYATSVIASDRFLAEKPDVAKRFIKAYAEAVEYTWANPLESAKSINKIVPEVDVKVAEDTITSIYELVYNPISMASSVGQFDVKHLASTWKWTSAAQGIEESSFDPEKTLNRGFLPEAK